MKRIISILCAVVFCIVPWTPINITADSAETNQTKFSATFLQNWMCRDWTLERWIQEFSMAKSAGFDSMILQSTYDIVRGECDAGGNAQDVNAYSSAETFCMYPSKQTVTYHSAQNGGDALAFALEAAKQTDMQLWLGTVNDDLWWEYGWGIPEDSYFADWSVSNAEICAGIISEIWERYGTKYGNQIAGWYYVNEIWNMDAACNGSDGGKYAQIIGGNIRATIQAVSECCPDKPILISPFFNPDLSESSQYTTFLKDILNTADFRPIDIYAGQDGGGKEYTPAVIREWAAAQKNAVDDHMQFWVNHECFNNDFSAKPISQLRENYCAVADLADGHILFSWDHYYAQNPELNAQFTAYTFETIPGDVNRDESFNISDVILLQKWLLAVPDTHLADWQAADLCEDDRLDVVDLCLMKRVLLQTESSSPS